MRILHLAKRLKNKFSQSEHANNVEARRKVSTWSLGMVSLVVPFRSSIVRVFRAQLTRRALLWCWP